MIRKVNNRAPKEVREGIMSDQLVKITIKGRVGLIELNRPKAMNALCAELIQQLNDSLKLLESNRNISVMVLTGSETVFAAGADIKEMKDLTFSQAFMGDFITKTWEEISKCRKPIIAAVSGYALGGGCEVAMMCDLIYAADNAKFGQPEITIGTIPGAGGTQRLPRFIGHAKAMEMCLTGKMISATEAKALGLVADVFPTDTLLTEVLKVARHMASMSLPVLMIIKESIKKAYEMPLHEGLMYERRLFHSTFALEDRKEGMTAFVEKRAPQFQNK